jgi:hypothetical protein
MQFYATFKTTCGLLVITVFKTEYAVIIKTDAGFVNEQRYTPARNYPWFKISVWLSAIELQVQFV